MHVIETPSTEASRQVPAVAVLTGVDLQGHVLLPLQNVCPPPRLSLGPVGVLGPAIGADAVGTLGAGGLPVRRRQVPEPTLAALVGNEVLAVVPPGVFSAFERIRPRIVLGKGPVRLLSVAGFAFSIHFAAGRLLAAGEFDRLNPGGSPSCS